jgi:hypothetical protein
MEPALVNQIVFCSDKSGRRILVFLLSVLAVFNHGRSLFTHEEIKEKR